MLKQKKHLYTDNKQESILREETESGTCRYFYNSKNQQIRIERTDGQIQENRYDAEGLRHEMRENEKLFRFVYQNRELLYEEGGDKETASCHLGAGIEAVRRGQRTYYYHPDEQLSTALITDETGTIKNQYRYDAFGAGLEISEELPNRIRYTGQQYDRVTEQYYLRARYYNPILGRFLQEDVCQGDGLNLYAYCRNNPVVYWDPSGLSFKDISPEDRIKIIKGQIFNKTNRPNYTYNEVRVWSEDGKKEYRVDSYEPPFTDGKGVYIEGQIVSRKYTVLSEVSVNTGYEYLSEAKRKYSAGAEIIDGNFNPKELRGKKLTGDLYLEVPKQSEIPKEVLERAKKPGITIRENTEPHPETERNSENNLLDGRPESEEANGGKPLCDI